MESSNNNADIENGQQQQQQQQKNYDIGSEKSEKISYLKKLWLYRKYFVIEPFVLCWLLPSCFHIISIQNLGLEKACRVNLGYPKYICDNVIDKTLNGIDCDDITIADDDNGLINSTSNMNLIVNPQNLTELLLALNNTITTTTTTTTSPLNDLTINNPSLLSYNFNYTVCKVERETQKQVTFINGIRGPIASIFPIIVILFAGGWSDRKGLRKPCMLFPMIGEALAATALLISAIWMDTIPMEVGSILERVLPAMLGGQTLMIMGIYSYLTASTEEKDRTFRFGIFAIFANIVPIIGIPFSGTLYKHLGYVYVFLIGDAIFILGIIYMIFFVEEIKTPKESSSEVTAKSEENTVGKDNPAFELTEVGNGETKTTPTTEINATMEIAMTAKKIEDKVSEIGAKKSDEKRKKEKVKKNCLMEFFDPSLASDCLKVFFKKRPNSGRLYLVLLVCSYFLFIGPTLGEIDYLYQFCLIALNWDGEQFSVYSTYSTIIVTLGTFLMTSISSKIFKMTDSMIGLISSICTVISRPMFAFSKATFLYYAATTVDMFVSTKAIAIKSIISSFVEPEELGRVYSVMGIADAFGGFIFPPIYSYIYSSTIDSFVGAFYLFGDLFFIPTGLIFALTYFLLRRNKSSQTGEGDGVDDNEDTVEKDYEEIKGAGSKKASVSFMDDSKNVEETTYM